MQASIRSIAMQARRLAAVAILSLGAAMPGFAQNGNPLPGMPAPVGPVIFNGMTENQVDAAYDQAFWDKAPPATGTRNTSLGDAVRARFAKPDRIQYGPSQYEFLDIYRTEAKKAPIMIFIHGGAWRGGSARGAAVPAEMFMNAGAHFVALDFVNTTQNQVLFADGFRRGSIMEMAQQVRRGVAWVYNNAHTFGGDRNRIYISGHSSGGHLGGVVMVTDWSEYGLPANTVKGGVLFSGMYELEPVSLSARNQYVDFNAPGVKALLSAQRRLAFLNAPVVIAHGSVESPEFIRQSREFADAVRAAGKPVRYIVGTGYNHFEFPDTFANPYGLLGRAAREMMDLPVSGKHVKHD